MATCQSCSAELPGEARFCPACGTAVAATETEELKLVTILFADVVGSTALGEALDAEGLRQMMSAYFSAMREEIEAEGGTVEKFIGDAVMAVFGIPVAHEDDAHRALRAAWRMSERMPKLNELLAERYGVRLEMRIGINTGEVVATRGSSTALGQVTGDPINVAARLEREARPGEVLVSERTARAGRGFNFRELGTLELRGREQSVRTFALVGEGGAERGIPGLRAPLVGRAEELTLLSALFERVRSERKPHLVTVYGAAGVGKSRLVGEFLDGLTEDGALVLHGRCLPYGQEVTYWPLAEILKTEAGVLDSDPSEVALEKLHKSGEGLFGGQPGVDWRRSTAALAYSIGLADPEVRFDELSPRQVRLEMHLAWRVFFSAMASDRPAVAVVEDVHWAEAALLDLLEELADRTEGPVLWICPARPELLERRPGWGGGKRNYSGLFLEPLSESESRRLLELLLEIEELPETVRLEVLSRAEGNPFFLEEIIRRLLDEGLLEHSGGRWRATMAIGEVRIPDTVQGVLAARMDLLGEPEKRALQCAAVVGRVFWSGAIGQLLEGSVPVEDVLEGLEERALVLSRLGSSLAGHREYIFRHILTRDVAYQSIPQRERGRLHAEVGRWLEEAVGGRQREVVELLAYHFAEAHQGLERDRSVGEDRLGPLREKAFHYQLLASQDAIRRLVTSGGRKFAERAVLLARTAAERADSLEALGAAHGLVYQGDDSWRSLRTAVDERLASGQEDASVIARTAALAVEVPSRWPGSMRTIPPEEEVARYLEIGLSHIGDEDSEVAARLLSYKSAWPWAFPASSRFDRSEIAAAEGAAVAMARRLGRPELESAVLDSANAAHITDGRYAQLLPGIRRRLELAQDLQDPWEMGDIYAMAGFIHYHLGRFREARDFGDEGYRRTAAQVPGVALHGLTWRALGRYALGDWDGLLEDLIEIEDLLGDRRSDPPYFAIRPFAAAALVHEIRADTAAADRLLSMIQALGERDRTIPRSWPAWLAPLLARRGRFEAARRMLDVLPAHNRGILLEARCTVLAEEGAWAEAGSVVREGREHAEESGLESLLAHLDRLEGRTETAVGEPTLAVEALMRSRRRFAELEATWEAACTDLALTEALQAGGVADAGREGLEKAVDTFERLGAVRELGRARSLLDSMT